ncbi:MAG: acyclic terpene utilization AtuA family protein [Actinomycetales bacterium]|nr:acyclic terpene utilization AtuA family protein [Actinomycetales bacterium]
MREPSAPRRPVRIGNCSGFLGDRLDAAVEQVGGGPLDVLTGDWLAELTMLILARQRMKAGPGSGYARTFLSLLEPVLGTCVERGIKVVTNAGGLDPDALAEQVHELASRLGIGARIGVVTGDDLMSRLPELREAGEPFVNLDTGERLDDLGITPITAHAYLGAAGITAALRDGMDIVITGRVTDAALALGPAAWWHGWSLERDEVAVVEDGDLAGQPPWDALAGAIVAGHVIECGAQATGGNYPFFADVPGLAEGRLPAFPIAEIAADGSSVITKHPDTLGMVTIGTVTAQLLYELGDPAYANPDAVADFGTIALEQVARDQVRISGVRGAPPPPTAKVAMNYLGGFRNSLTLVLTGRDAQRKADAACRATCGVDLHQARTLDAWALAAASALDVDQLHIEFTPAAEEDPERTGTGQAHLRITVKDTDAKRIGKAFTTRIIAPALSSIPGYFAATPPAEPAPYGVYWPTIVAAERIEPIVREWQELR